MLPRFFSDIVNGVWAMDKQYADAYLPVIEALLDGKGNVIITSENFREQNNERKELRYFSAINGVYQISEYGESDPPELAPKNSIAILNITDAITKYDAECGPSGMQTKSNLLLRAEANPNIKGVILNIDSPGGEGYAAQLFANTINSIGKPIISFIDDLSASAAYWISSQTNWITANTEVAKVGSIGTYVTIADYTDFFKQKGIRLVDVYADKSTDKNKAYKAAIDGDTSLLKKDINKFNEVFINSIKTGRAEKLADEKLWSTGKLFDADEALKLGLIDSIGSFEDMLLSFAQSLNL